jgi:hypothetical protein
MASKTCSVIPPQGAQVGRREYTITLHAALVAYIDLLYEECTDPCKSLYFSVFMHMSSSHTVNETPLTLCHYEVVTEKSGVAATFYTCIREVVASYLGQDTG